MIPDYVKQMQEIQGQLDSTANVLENDWKDAVKQRFFGDFVTPFDDDVKNFLYGGPNVYGPGLDELLKLMEKQMDAMSKVAGVNVTADVVEVTLGGQRHLRGLDGKIVADAGLHDGPHSTRTATATLGIAIHHTTTDPSLARCCPTR